MTRTSCLLLIAGVLWLAAGPPRTILAKSYDFPLVAIDARVNPDGSMLVVERRTYSFSGDFSWATYTLERRGWTAITDIGVADERGAYAPADGGAPRTFRVTHAPDEVEIRWAFRAEDEDLTFTIRYRVEGVVTRYRDTAELYWRFVGAGWDVPTREVRVGVTVPGASEQDLRAWGHGPLTGVTGVGDGRVALAVEGLEPETFVEARILFPGTLVPDVRMTDADALPRILAEEARWARQANLERAAPLLNLLMFPAALIGAVAVWGTLYLRAGREHRIRLEHHYLREPPERYPPVYRFTRTDQPDVPLPASERHALGLLFAWSADRKSITDAQFWSEAWKRTNAGTLFRAWQNAVAEDAQGLRFFDRASERVQRGITRIYWLFVLAGVLIAVAGIAWLRIPLLASLVAFPVLGLPITWLRGPLARRTVEGATQLARWRAFRRFLMDFSMLRDAPPPAVAVWEHYLPYAVTLGVAEKVIRQFPSVYGEAAGQYRPSWYSSSRVATAGTSRAWDASVASLSRSLSRSIAVASSPRSSSSGRSGGFSGGSRTSSGGSRGGGGSGGRAG